MLLAVAWLGPMTAARAQVAVPEGAPLSERYTAVRDRRHPEIEAIGIDLGSFNLRPAFGMSGIYDDNVLATEGDKRDDLAIRFSPQLMLQSNWGGADRASLRIAAQADRYTRLTTENGVDVDINADSAVGIDRYTTVSASARWQYQRESRLSQDAFAQTARPVRFSTATAALGMSHNLGRIGLSGEATLQRFNYDDARATNGTPIDEDFRDSDFYRLRGRIAYSQTASLGWFGQVTYDWRTYRQQVPGGIQRDSKGIEILAGAAFEPAALLRGEIGVGYLSRRYQGPTFQNFSGFAINGKVEFFVTQLTTVTVSAKRQANDAGIPRSTGYITTGGQVGVDHELLRSLILSASVSYYADTFNGIDRRDKRWAARAAAEYQMNRNVGLRMSYDRVNLSSDGVDRYKEFKDNRVLLGVTVRL